MKMEQQEIKNKIEIAKEKVKQAKQLMVNNGFRIEDIRSYNTEIANLGFIKEKLKFLNSRATIPAIETKSIPFGILFQY